MKNLLFLINTLDGGGAEKVLVDVVNALSDDGYKVTVMTVIDRGVFKERLAPSVTYKSIVRIKNAWMRHALAYAVAFIMPAGLIHKLFIGNDYDCEVAFLEGLPTKLVGASKNKQSKKIAWVHTDLINAMDADNLFNSEAKRIRCYKKFDKIICVSESVRKSFVKRFGNFENVEVKYNLIDDEAIREKAKKRIESPTNMRIVSVGRLEKEKGYDRLLKIAKGLKDEGFAFELLIVGEGSERINLEQYMKENGLKETVRLPGFTDNPYPYMQSADFLVFPSRIEGMSTVVTEAIILGKPVVVSNCSGMHEILGDSRYGVIADNTEKALYSAVKRMLIDKSMRKHYETTAMERSHYFTKNARLMEIEELF